MAVAKAHKTNLRELPEIGNMQFNPAEIPATGTLLFLGLSLTSASI